MFGRKIIAATGTSRGISSCGSLPTDSDGDIIMADAPSHPNALQRAGVFYRQQVHHAVKPALTFVANSVKRGVKRGADVLDDALRDAYLRCQNHQEFSFKRFKRLPIAGNRITSKAVLEDTLPVDYLRNFHPDSLAWSHDTFAHLGVSNHIKLMKFVDELIHNMLLNKFHYFSMNRSRLDPDNLPSDVVDVLATSSSSSSPTGKLTREPIAEPKEKCFHLSVLLHNHMIEMFNDNRPELFQKSGLQFLDRMVNFRGQYASIYADRGRLPMYEQAGMSPLGKMRFPYVQHNADPTIERNKLFKMIETAQLILSHHALFPASFPGQTLAGIIADIDAIRMDELPPSYVDWPGKYDWLPGTYPDDNFHHSLMDTVAMKNYRVERMWEHWHPTPRKIDLVNAKYSTPLRQAMKLNDIIYDTRGDPQASKGALKKELHRQGTPVPKQAHFLSPNLAWYHPAEHKPVAKQQPPLPEKPALKQRLVDPGGALGLSKTQRLSTELRVPFKPTPTIVEITRKGDTPASSIEFGDTKNVASARLQSDSTKAQEPMKATQEIAGSCWLKGKYQDMATDYKGRKPKPNPTRTGPRTIQEVFDDDPFEHIFTMPQWKIDKMQCAKQLEDEAQYRVEQLAAEERRKDLERLETEQREKEREEAETLREQHRLSEELRLAEERRVAEQQRYAEGHYAVEAQCIADEERAKIRGCAEAGHLREPSKPLVADLSVDWTEKVLNILNFAANREIVKTPEGTALKLQDFGTLVPPTEWLNDEIINGTIAHLVNFVNQQAGIKNTRTHTPKIQYINSLAAKMIVDGGEPTPRSLRRLGIYPDNFFDIDSIFFPINRAHHWTLLVVRPKLRQIFHLDSLSPQGHTALKNHALKWVRNFLGASFVENEWSLNDVASVQQCNGVDCGVHVITNGICVALGIDPNTYMATDMPMQRLRVAAVLLNGGFKGEFDLNGY